MSFKKYVLLVMIAALALFAWSPVHAVELSPPQMVVLNQTTGYVYVDRPAGSDNNDDAEVAVMGLGLEDAPAITAGSCTVALSNGCEATFTLIQGRVNLVAMRYFPDGTGAYQNTGYYGIVPWLDFDGDGAPPGLSSDDLMPNLWAGINWGTSTNARWRFTGPYGVNSGNGVYFDSATGTSRTLTFVYGNSTLDSVRFFGETSGSAINYTVSNGTDTNASGSCTGSCTVLTSFTTPTGSVTVTITQGWDVGVDDVQYRLGNGTGNILY